MRLSKYHKAKKSKWKKYIIVARDIDGNLQKLLEHIKKIGNIGHSFSIIVDPANKDYTLNTGWDGDGSDHIKDVKVEEIDEP